MGITDKVKESVKRVASDFRGRQSSDSDTGQGPVLTRDPTQAELDRAEAESREQAAEREAEGTRPSS